MAKRKRPTKTAAKPKPAPQPEVFREMPAPKAPTPPEPAGQYLDVSAGLTSDSATPPEQDSQASTAATMPDPGGCPDFEAGAEHRAECPANPQPAAAAGIDAGGGELHVSVPQAPLPAGANCEPLHLHVNLTREQSLVVRRLRVALLEGGAICKTGAPGRPKLVTNQADAVRWLLERVAAAAS